MYGHRPKRDNRMTIICFIIKFTNHRDVQPPYSHKDRKQTSDTQKKIAHRETCERSHMTIDRKQTRDTAWHIARTHSTRKGAEKRQVIQLNIQNRILYTTTFDWHIEIIF